MAARAGARPRPVRARRRRRSRNLWQRLQLRRLARAEFIGLALAAGAAAAVPWLIDVPTAAQAVRRAVLESLGFGVLLLSLAAIAGGIVVHRRLHRRHPQAVLRYGVGTLALLLFAWGALGLNHADWTIGGVSMRDVSLGGRAGEAIVGSWWRILLWLAAGGAAAWLLAPRPTAWAVRNAPRWAAEAWKRRYPHRTASAAWRATRTLRRAAALPFRRRTPGDIVIDATLTGFAPPVEEQPRVFRPSFDPASPGSIIGVGAAAAFRHEPPPEPPALDEPASDAESVPDAEAPEEPRQLPLTLEATPSGWQLPPLDLLNPPQPTSNRKHDNAARAQLIVDTLASFGVDASVVEINEGPTVTQFGVEPGWEIRYKEVPLKDERGRPIIGPDGRPKTERIEVGRTRVRVNRITALQNDLALALAAPSLRIEAPVPGRAIVGIEVPNDTASVVTLRGVMETKEFRELARKSKLALALGRGVAGTPVVADLAKMPHLLIAGATGSGKSVCMNAIITCLMMNATPDEVRFVMIDPKRVELTAYRGIPHLAFSEVIVDVDKVVGVLQAVVSEMEARYRKFAEMAVRNIEAYNRHPRVLRKLPYWVVIIDELADLMMAAPFEVEKLLCRLAQLARATGIHLVVATQRPSVDVVTGLIKANFPTRIAFAVTSQTDSRTILDMGGAEKLLGRGDMLYLPTDAAKPIRIQGVYVSDAEIERVVQYWKDERFAGLAPERADALLEQALVARNGGDEDLGMSPDDPLLSRARTLAMSHRRISPSMLQRRLGIGYMKAAKLIEALEAEGIVGPREEGESRRVLVRDVADEDEAWS
ncbi:DNA translocase SpoIIIE [bacterium HR29]|jgi:S-DNA-T family DNA segregation ATPase FtsK/SpoIIIE|nr:DNA translocase SpoIIIE [bacterium HR29]